MAKHCYDARVLTAVIFGAMAVGQNSTFAPDYAEAKMSAQRMFALFDKKPSIDSYSKTGIFPVRYFDGIKSNLCCALKHNYRQRGRMDKGIIFTTTLICMIWVQPAP